MGAALGDDAQPDAGSQVGHVIHLGRFLPLPRPGLIDHLAPRHPANSEGRRERAFLETMDPGSVRQAQDRLAASERLGSGSCRGRTAPGLKPLQDLQSLNKPRSADARLTGGQFVLERKGIAIVVLAPARCLDGAHGDRGCQRVELPIEVVHTFRQRR